MKTIVVPFLILCRLLLSIIACSLFAINLHAQTIKVDFQAPTQPIPEVYKPGVFLVPKTSNGADDFLTNGIHHNSIRTIALETAMNHWTASDIDGVMAVLELMKPNILLANSRCDKLVMPILKMPAWLSSSTDTTSIPGGFRVFNAMPPSDYPTWSLLMDSIVNKINNQWGLDPYYEIWNEPDNEYWLGTEAEYFEFFKKTYFAIKNPHPNAKIGGPTVSSFAAQFNPTLYQGYLTNTQLDSTIIGQVIDSCANWGAHLDFISWHNFGVNLHNQTMIFDYLNYKLTSSGHGLAPYIVSEWNLSSELRESALDPAFMINYTQSMHENGVTAHEVAAWQDFDSTSTEFDQDYGLLSWGALHKPSWKALQLLNSLGGVLLQTDSSDYKGLTSVASYENDTLKVLISNFSLPGYIEAGLTLYYDREINSKELIDAGFTPTLLDSIWKGLIVLPNSDALSVAINSVIPDYQNAEFNFYNGRNIDLLIPGVTGIHTGQKIVIDSTNNNVIFQYDSLMNEGYTRQSAVDYLYPNSDFTSQNITMTDSVYSFHLNANGVAYIEFYIPEIVLSISENATNNIPLVFPNPTSAIVELNINDQDLQKVTIYALNGKLVKTTSETTFSVNDLPDGNYMLVIQTKNEVFTRKLIKE